MRWSPPAHRGFLVMEPITVYRVIGRRPSEVYVDSGQKATRHTIGDRLWDPVFLQSGAGPGDQLQDRPGGLVLVTADGEAHPIQLSPPEARSVETAFTHADHVLAADRALADQMVVDGKLAAGATRRLKRPMIQMTQRKFGEGHPLVVDSLPDADGSAAMPAQAHQG
jgi:hypothetical protein